ncbi:MAG: hypothetical protein FWE72_04650 [Spirochaetaceae bacterium]|nr:hypothetical protein [Spirochaetaceae bacterium]
MFLGLRSWPIILFFITISVNSLEAQNKAFLQSGPFPCDGMPGIGFNSIPGYRGIYMFPLGTMGKNDGTLESVQTSITVYFTQTVVPLFSNWRTVVSSPYTIYETESETIFIYTHFENWTFFIDFHIKENINLSFAENIVKQMIYFAKDGSNFINASFPAVIDF